MSKSETENLLDQLAEIGKTAYKPEYQDKISKWRKIGLAISHSTDDVKGVIEMTYAFLQDWNYHGVCAILDWVFPKKGEGKFWDISLYQVQKIISKNRAEIVMWNKNHTEIITKHAKITVKVEWLKEKTK
jgi:hypothetical protein